MYELGVVYRNIKRADAHAVSLVVDAGQARDRLKIDQVAIMQRALLHQNNQRRAAGDHAAFVAMFLQKFDGFVQRARLQQVKRTNRH